MIPCMRAYVCVCDTEQGTLGGIGVVARGMGSDCLMRTMLRFRVTGRSLGIVGVLSAAELVHLQVVK